MAKKHPKTTIVSNDLWLVDPAKALVVCPPAGRRYLWNKHVQTTTSVLHVTDLLIKMMKEENVATLLGDIFGTGPVPADKIQGMMRHLLLPLNSKIEDLLSHGSVSTFLGEQLGVIKEMSQLSASHQKQNRRMARREQTRELLHDTIACLGDKAKLLNELITNPPAKAKWAPFCHGTCIDHLGGIDLNGNRRKDRPPETIEAFQTTQILQEIEKWLKARKGTLAMPNMKLLKGIEQTVMAKGDGSSHIYVIEEGKKAKKKTNPNPKSKQHNVRRKPNSQLIRYNGDDDATQYSEFMPGEEKLIATSAAYPAVSKEIRDQKLPLDVMFPDVGSALYDALEAADVGFVRPAGDQLLEPIQVDCRPLISEAYAKKLSKIHGKIWLVAPFVVGFNHALSPEVRTACLRAKDKLPHVRDRLTGSGKGFLRAAFRPECHVKEPLTPVINLTSKSVQAVVGSPVERAMMALMAEVSNLYGDRTNHIMQQRFEAAHPEEGCGGISDANDEEEKNQDVIQTQARSFNHRTSKRRSPRHKPQVHTCRTGNQKMKPLSYQRKLPTRAKKSNFRPKLSRRQNNCIPRIDWNIIVSKVGKPRVAKYDMHQDIDDLLICPPENTDEPLLKGERSADRFPYMEEMSVATLCLGYESYTAKSKIVWSADKKGDLGHLITGDNSAHLQSYFVQYFGIFHNSDVIPGTLPGSFGCRTVDSFRDGADPNRELKSYCAAAQRGKMAPENFESATTKKPLPYNEYEWLQVGNDGGAMKAPEDTRIVANHWWKAGEGKWYVPRNAPAQKVDGGLEEEEAGVRKRQASGKDSCNERRYKNATSSDYSLFRRRVVEVKTKNGTRQISGVPQVLRTIGIGQQSRKETLRRSKFSERCIKEFEKVLQFQDEDGTAEKFQPLFLQKGRPIPAGHKLEFTDVPECQNTRYKTEVMDKENPNKAVLSGDYKNGQDGVNQHAEFFREWNEWRFGPASGGKEMMGPGTGNEDYTRDESKRADFRRRFNEIKEVEIQVGGGGGSSQAQGSQSFSAVYNRRDDPTHFTGGHQKLDNVTSGSLLDCYLRGNAIALFLNYNKWGGKKARMEHELRLLSYYDCCDVRHDKISIKDILKRKGIDARYAADNLFNLSYMLHGFWEFKLRLSFDFDTMEKICSMWEAKGPPQSIVVSEDDKRKLTAPLEVVKEMELETKDEERDEALRLIFSAVDAKRKKKKKENKKCMEVQEKRFPDAWISPERIVDYYCTTLGATDFLSAITSTVDGDKDLRYVLDPDEMLAALVHLGAVAAVRSNPNRSSRWKSNTDSATVLCVAEETTIERPQCESDCARYAIPLIAEFTDHFPDNFRSKWLPCPNRDDDVATASFRHNVDCLIKEVHSEFSENELSLLPQELPGFKGSLQLPDLSAPINQTVMNECIYMASAARFTGNKPLIEQFPQWRFDKYKESTGLNGRYLPRLKDAARWTEFILEMTAGADGISSAMSKQHDRRIPDEIGSNRNNFKTFFVNMAKANPMLKECRYPIVSKERTNLLFAMTHMMSGCCPTNLQMNSKLKFICHQVIADLESKFIGLMGSVELDSVAHGPGSSEGMAMLSLAAFTSQEGIDQAPMTKWEERFEALHGLLIERLLGLCGDSLLCLGYRIWNGRIVSSTGREYSRTDTEHMCCKLYLCATNSHSSRTLSENRSIASDYCWPVWGNDDWVNEIMLHFDSAWQAFIRLAKLGKLQPFPVQLDFLDSRKIYSDDATEPLRSSKRRINSTRDTAVTKKTKR